MSTKGEKSSSALVSPFPLMSKGQRSLVFGECLVYLQMYLQVPTDGGDQTPKWLPSSPKGEIVGIMTNVLSLMETYLVSCP